MSVPRVRRAARLVVALTIGAAAGWYRWHSAALGAANDVGPVWAAARALLHGVNPYAAVGPNGPYVHPWPFVYPMPAVVLFVPLALLSEQAAAVLFAAVGATALAFALTRRSWWPLVVFAGPTGLMAVQLAQWSPLLTAAAVLPALGALLVIKPTVGAALATALPRPRVATIGMAALLVVSFALLPEWPQYWLANARAVTHLTAPVTVLPAGPLLLLALVRWRRPEARLLAALACVPHTLLLYEAVPLYLVVGTPIESLTLTVLTYAVWMRAGGQSGYPSFAEWAQATGKWMVMLLYLPCLVMVLRRPNIGEVPAWIDRAVVAATRRLRERRAPRPGVEHAAS